MDYSKIKEYKQAKHDLAVELDREPTENEIESVTGFDPKKMEAFDLEDDDSEDIELLVRISIANNTLRKCREKLGLSQKQVDSKFGWCGQTYSQIERCYRYPTKKEAIQIASLFGKEVDQLFPKYLEVFTEKWKKETKQKTVKMKTERLDGGEALCIEAPKTGWEGMEQEAAKQYVQKILSASATGEFTLSPREERIIEMRFGLKGGDSHTFQEVGQFFGLSVERVRQIELKALEKIRIANGLL